MYSVQLRVSVCVIVVRSRVCVREDDCGETDTSFVCLFVRSSPVICIRENIDSSPPALGWNF